MRSGSCPICRAHLGNTRHLYMVETGVGQHVIDVSKARRVVADGRLRHLVEQPLLDRLLEVNGPWVEDHIDHVDLRHPGILGQLFGGIFLLDGTYRALGSMRQHIPFYAHMLTFDETVSCLVDEPDITPLRAIQEIQEMLRQNPGSLDVDVSLSGELKGANLPRQMEELVRSQLSKEDNGRVRLIFHHRGKVLL